MRETLIVILNECEGSAAVVGEMEAGAPFVGWKNRSWCLMSNVLNIFRYGIYHLFLYNIFLYASLDVFYTGRLCYNRYTGNERGSYV